MSDRIQSYKDFWPFYLSEHSKPATRNIHIAGTLTGIAVAVAAVVSGVGLLALGGLAVAYGAAWTAHALIEKNTPATFKYPLWSLASDFKMLGHWATGSLQKEVDKHLGVTPDAKPARQPAPSQNAPKRGLTRKLAQKFGQAVQRVLPMQKQAPAAKAARAPEQSPKQPPKQPPKPAG
jgi:hypothetical protein